MLYVTTRNNLDVFTSAHALQQPYAGDGGCWKPFGPVRFSPEEIAAFGDISFNAVVALVLNKLFDKKLTAWDVDFCIGRYPVRLNPLANRVTVGEPWHNPQWQFSSMSQRLIALIGGEKGEGWADMAVRIAVLFGIYAQMMRSGSVKPGEAMDVAVLSGSFQEPMSAWYARRWGLPIGSIVCCCNENNGVWNLLCHGQMRTDEVSVSTCVPNADVVIPRELERLICECGGIAEMEDYLGCCETGRTYYPDEQTLQALRTGLYVSVVSSHRIAQTVKGVWDSHRYLLSAESALVYSGLQDYRAKKGQLRPAVVMTQASPRMDASFVAEALGVAPEQVNAYF